MNLARFLIWALILILPLTAVLVLAVDDVLLPHASSKHPSGASRAALKLPSGIATPMPGLVAPAAFGAIAAASTAVAPSIVLRPPFVPPRG